MTLAAATQELTISQALNQALREEMQRDPNVFLIGEEIGIWGAGGGIFGVTLNLIKEFGAERVRDTPISEEAIAGLACGAAVTGMRPVAEIMYADFLALAMDPIVNQAAKLRYMFGGKASVPMVIRAQEGAGRGNAAQHSQSLEAWFMHVPGLKVAVPSTPRDAKGLLKSAIRDDNPVIFLEHKALYATKGEVPSDEYTVPFGVSDVKRAGSDVTVVGIHTMVHRALAAAEKLAGEGISVEVIDPRTLVPLDIETIVASVRKTKHLVIAHEAVERGGVAGEIAMQVMDRAFDYLDAPIKRVCGRNVPIPYNLALERLAIPQEEDVIQAIRDVLAGTR
jgi:acetoin:2,6-dichlorophenolindophenol oxidoreductase subunit beta